MSDASRDASSAVAPLHRRPAISWRRNGLALAVATMGLIDLASALFSHLPERLLALRHLVPTQVLDTSRTFTLLAGAMLLVTAWGLRRGKRRAFVAALFLCAVSVPVNLLKAFDLEEATVAAALMFALGVSADAFQVRSRELSLATLRSWALWAALALVIYAVGGSWIIHRWYGYPTSLGSAVAEASARLIGVGPPPESAPSSLPRAEQRIMAWYLRSLPLLSLTLIVGTALASLRPAAHRSRHRTQAGKVATLLREYGDSSVSAFALAADSDYFFSANGRAVIAYRFESDTLLAIGDPMGPPEELRSLVEDFARFCAERDWTFGFFQARPERLPHYRELGLRALHIGEDPVLWPERFSLEGGAIGDVRRAVRKAEAAELDARHYLPGISPFDPEHDPDSVLASLQAVSSEWLRHHRGGEKGFCMGRFEPARLSDSWLVVAWNAKLRRAEGFVTWVPIWARRGWALDLMRQRSDSTSGTMEFLIVRSVEAARGRGDAMLSLSLSALAKVDEPRSATPSEPDRARDFLMQHLARFYDFKGLFHWKKKFAPTFEDRYLVYPGALALPRIGWALVRAQGSSGPASNA